MHTVARRTRLTALLALLLPLIALGPAPLPPRVAQALAATNFPIETRRLFGDIVFNQSVAFGDMDGDGDLDLVAGRTYQSAVFLNDGRGNYPSGAINCDDMARFRCFNRTALIVSSVAVGDLDGDSDLDIVTATFDGTFASFGQLDARLSIRVSYNQGGSFPANTEKALDFSSSPTVRVSFSRPTGDRRVALGDVNGDGLLDIVAGGGLFQWVDRPAGADPTIGVDSAIYLNSPNGFPLTPSASFAPAMSIGLGDLDLNGALDIVAGGVNVVDTNNRFGPGVPATFLNDSAIYLNPPLKPQPPAQIAPTSIFEAAPSLALGDLDGDGWLDIAAAGATPLPTRGAALNPGTGQSRVYLNNQAGGFPTVRPFGPNNLDVTKVDRSLAVGDLNGDGRLDIAVGRGATWAVGEQNSVYLNQGGGSFVSGPVSCAQVELADCFGTGFDTTPSVALADIDGDGSLDIAAGNDGGVTGEQGAVYLNSRGGRFVFAATPFGPDPGLVRRVELADLDRDGDLDLVVAREWPADDFYVGVFLNTDGGRYQTLSQRLGALRDPQESEAMQRARQPLALTVGDLNGDGHLDIVVGRNRMPGEVYLNDGAGRFPAAPLLFGSATNSVLALALGDLNGDGDLDVVSGNELAQTTTYTNDGKGNLTGERAIDAQWDGDPTRDVGLGDLDGDGDLDLVTGRNYNYNYVYMNRGDGSFGPGSRLGTRGSTVAIGDVDGDSDLDIAIGSYLSSIFLNDGSGNFPAQRNLPGSGGVALGDMDNDADLDAIVYGIKQSAVYLNDGGGGFPRNASRTFAGINDEMLNIALGDVDGDGDRDIVAGARQYFLGGNTRSVIYLNGHQAPASLPNNPPSVRVGLPAPLAEANFFASPTIITTPVITIGYTLTDPEANPVRAVRAEYSLDGGGSWRPAAPSSGTVTTTLATSAQGEPHSFGWDTFASGFFGQSDSVVFRVVALPALSSRSGQVAGPFVRPYAAASGFPFRARGTQVKVVDSTGAPRPEALVLRRPVGATGAGELIARPGGAPYSTDANGFLRGRGTLALSDTLVALLPVPLAATDPYSDSYTLYQTNIIPTRQGLGGFTVARAGEQVITVLRDAPLALFHLDVALEWDARYDQRFMAQLEYDLQRTSEFLFDATNGQAALGDINLWHDKENWDTAHVRIFASNRVRPSASIGGVAGAIFTRTVTLDDGPRTNTYGPGQVRMGAVWSRFGDQSGSSLSEDWPRTLAHELGHYLLFLDDNYLGFDEDGQVVPVESCPGLMGDPYASLELRPAADWLPGCGRTFSQATYGRADWDTLTNFYPAIVPPPAEAGFADLLPGPALSLAVTSIRSNDPLTPTERLSVPIFYTVDQEGERLLPGPSASAFLFQDSPSDADAAFDRITNLGRANIDQVLARGARVGDRLCLFEPAARRQSCELIGQDDETLTLIERRDWRPDLLVTPVNSRTLAIELRTLDASGAPVDLPGVQSVTAQLYPGEDRPADPAITLGRVTGSPGTFAGSLALSGPVVDAYLHIAAGPAAGQELVAGIALSGDVGVGPEAVGRIRSGVGRIRSGVGRIRSGVGRIRSGVSQVRAGGAPVSSAEGDVLLVNETLVFSDGQLLLLQAIDALPPPPAWATPLGQGYRLSLSEQAPDLTGSTLGFSYRGAEVPAEEEAGIRAYFYDPATRRWEQLDTTLDTYHNIVSAPGARPGIYALMRSRLLPSLNAGWNLISYPGAARPVREALASIEGKYTTVYGYDQSSPADPWRVHAAGLPADWGAIVNDLRGLEPGRPYWLRATEPIDAPLVGGRAADELAADAAQSLSLPPATYYGVAPGAAAAGPATVEARVGGQLCGRATASAQTIGGESRLAFVIDVRAAGAGESVGCGTSGAAVRFSIIQGGRVIAEREAAWSNDIVQALEAAERRVFLPLLAR